MDAPVSKIGVDAPIERVIVWWIKCSRKSSSWERSHDSIQGKLDPLPPTVVAECPVSVDEPTSPKSVAAVVDPTLPAVRHPYPNLAL